MKKKRVLKIGLILFISSICIILATHKKQSKVDSLFYNNIEALATGEDTNPNCSPGPGYCTYNNHAYPGIP